LTADNRPHLNLFILNQSRSLRNHLFLFRNFLSIIKISGSLYAIYTRNHHRSFPNYFIMNLNWVLHLNCWNIFIIIFKNLCTDSFLIFIRNKIFWTLRFQICITEWGLLCFKKFVFIIIKYIVKWFHLR